MRRHLFSVSCQAAFSFFLVSANASANEFEVAQSYVEYLDARGSGNRQEAEEHARHLLKNLRPGDTIYEEIQQTLLNDLPGVLSNQSAVEVDYATGLKNEYYCAGIGLVYAEASHNDGSFSKLALIDENRRIEDDSYTVVQDGGNWTYELSNSFREPTRSRVWQTYGRKLGDRAGSFNIMEVREANDGRVDQGMWLYDWEGGNRYDRRHSINGSASEPVRMFMAMQYQLWGSWDLGFDLKMEVGYEDSLKGRVAGKTAGEIDLVSSREVKESLPTFSYIDSDDRRHGHADCFRVEVIIEPATK